MARLLQRNARLTVAGPVEISDWAPPSIPRAAGSTPRTATTYRPDNP
jgi:hypothetical protein